VNAALLVFLAGVGGCNTDKGVSVADSPATTIGAVTIAPLNAIMAVGDTLQFSMTAKSVAGTPLASYDSVRYFLDNITDTLRVRVTPSGLVTARDVSSGPVLLDVLTWKGEAARADQAILQVTATAIPGATLSIQPAPSDSTKLALGSAKMIVPVVANQTGQSVSNVWFRFTLSDADAAKVGCFVPSFSTSVIPVSIAPVTLQASTCLALPPDYIFALTQSGTVWIHASATVYGVPLRDSVQYTLINGSSGTVWITDRNLNLIGGEALFGPVYIAPGGTVTFLNYINSNYHASVVYTFDNPAAATATTPPSSQGGASGNITALTSGQGSSRQFLTAGTYTYTATVTGTVPPFTSGTFQGRIIVQ